MDKGIDENELFTDQSTREVTIVYKDKEWDFSVRSLTWKENGDVMRQAAKMDIGGRKGEKKSISMDMTAYNIAYLTKAIVKSPFKNLSMSTFMKLDEKFGDLLVDAIVDPEGMDDDEEGNLEDQSEV